MNEQPARPFEILLLEDSALDAELIEEHLRRSDVAHRTDRVWTRKDFTEALDRQHYDLIIADYALPSFDGMTALEIAAAKVPDTPFIFVSGTLGEETAIESLKKGATDYVVKQRLTRLPVAVMRALTEAKEKAALRRAEQHQRLLINELNHRVKNTLATVQAIAHQTLRAPDVPESARRAFTERLVALARAHDILTEESWEGADIGAVIASALDPHGGGDHDRFHLDGPSLRLTPKMALSLAMALHELATNAAKYGALSVRAGCVDIVWTAKGTDAARRLNLVWTEKDGPPVSPPTKKGFGSRLIERSVAAELKGEARIAYHTGGVVCTFDAPLPPTS